jgi:tetratricopeptide (TPR) repeat protein
MELPERFFAEGFERAFTRGTRKKRRRMPASREIAALHAIELAPAFARFADILGEYEREPRYGAFGWFGGKGGWTIDWLAGKNNALAHAIDEPYRHGALLSASLEIGCDHSGNLWLVSLDAVKEKNAVFLFDHDTGEVKPAADSIEAFVLVLDILEREKKPTRAERLALDGRVGWPCFADYVAVAGPSLDIPRASARRFDEMRDLLPVLAGYRNARRPAASRHEKNASEIAAQMLRRYLRGEDAKLRALLRRHAKHPARLVRDAAAHLKKMSLSCEPEGEDSQTFHRMRLLDPRIPRFSALDVEHATHEAERCFEARDWDGVLGAYEPIPEELRPRESASHLGYAMQNLGRHEEAIALFRRAQKSLPGRAHLHAALCFSLYALERWKEMHASAKRAAKLEPESSYAHQQIAIACLGQDDARGAIRASKRALELDPRNAYAAYTLASVLATRGERDAVPMLERALRLAPELRDALASDRELTEAIARLKPESSPRTRER